MGNKSVDRAAMQRATQQLETKHQQIQTLQNRLRDQMNDLRSRWHGQASDTFQRGYANFDGEFEKVKDRLEEIHQKLVTTLRDYGVREEENVATANQIAGLIG